MHTITKLLFHTLWMAYTATLVSQVAAKEPLPSSNDAVQAAVISVMNEYHVPGVAIAVTSHGEHTFYNFGVASKDTQKAVTSDTLFEIGSVSKTFTATLATYAQALGRLSLGDSPARYFPELSGSNWSHVTLVNLGTHTAGGFAMNWPFAMRCSTECRMPSPFVTAT